jgi:putative integral membrane protein (TIGR02587 family)
MGLSVLLSALLLVLLDRVGCGTSLENAFGVIALASIPVSIGFSLGVALAPRRGGEKAEQIQGGGGDLLVAAAGALVFALNIAPTAEPILLAAQLDGVRLGILVVASLVLPYLMVFYAEFGGRERRVATDGATQGPITQTLLAYAAAFVLSAAMLAMFGVWTP